MKIVSPSAILLGHTPDPELLIERAGRVCWKSEDRISDDSHAEAGGQLWRRIPLLLLRKGQPPGTGRGAGAPSRQAQELCAWRWIQL